MQTLCVPSIGLDDTLLDRLADSIDFHIPWKVAVNNGPLGALDGFARRHRDWFIKEPGNNLGVAGSWNFCATLFPDEPTILLMNEDAWFLPGQLEQMCRCADANHDAPIVHLNDSNAFYCFVWTKAGRDKFGTFDENFWPGYYEDDDMRVRHRKDGIYTYPYALQGQTPVPHGKPRTGGMNYNAFIQGCGLFARAYWLKKWGDFNFEKAVNQTPYRDHRLKPSEWVWDPAHRAKLHPIFETFMSLPNPSIYE